ncbi:C-C motif chemokine 20-like [Pristis pectinata]|uniref:C-C motif chemokine 20-like n=1 Tax=Pristis pectinata TaxID=685728 RepID=UPI00223DFFF2|nr:C-C motif chemokine 20-like [Pristis pectinata]
MGHNPSINASLISLVILNLLFISGTYTVSVSVKDCCLSYSPLPLPFSRIAGYVEQKSNEICDIDAIVFYTVKGRWICANPKDKWVRRSMHFLSKRLEKMSAKSEAYQPAQAKTN